MAKVKQEDKDKLVKDLRPNAIKFAPVRREQNVFFNTKVYQTQSGSHPVMAVREGKKQL